MPSLNGRMLIHCWHLLCCNKDSLAMCQDICSAPVTKSIQWILFFISHLLFIAFFLTPVWHFSCCLTSSVFFLYPFVRSCFYSLFIPSLLLDLSSSLSFYYLQFLLHLLLYSSTIKLFSFSLPPVPVHSCCHLAALFFHVHICLDVRGRTSYLPHADWATQHQLRGHEVLLRHRLGRARHYHR